VTEPAAPVRPRTLPLTRVYVTGVSCTVLAGLNAALPQPHDLIGWVLRIAPYVSAILWLDADGRAREFTDVHDMGLFSYVAGLVLIPWYAWKTRGPHGWWLAVFLYIPIFAPSLAAGVVRLVVPYRLPPGTDVFEAARGMWAVGSTRDCVSKAHTITFSDDRQTMTLEFMDDSRGKFQITYDTVRFAVRGVAGSIIHADRIGDTTRTATGAPVTWDFLLTSADTYRWRRTDWPATMRSAERVRCP